MAGTPWSDLSKSGDTYFTNEFVDNVLGSYDGQLAASAQLYAGTHDLKEPLLSPLYGDSGVSADDSSLRHTRSISQQHPYVCIRSCCNRGCGRTCWSSKANRTRSISSCTMRSNPRPHFKRLLPSRPESG